MRSTGLTFRRFEGHIGFGSLMDSGPWFFKVASLLMVRLPVLAADAALEPVPLLCVAALEPPTRAGQRAPAWISTEFRKLPTLLFEVPWYTIE